MIIFKRARWLSLGRPYGPIRQIYIHDAEFPELVDSAERLQSICAASDARQASWHYAADCDSITQSVRDEDRAWCAKPGNDFGLHFELAGRYYQTKDDWLDEYGLAMFRLVIPFIAHKCREHDIPARWLTIDELIKNERGIVGHRTCTYASQKARRLRIKKAPWFRNGKWRITDHIDPGKNFPVEWFMDRLIGGFEDDSVPDYG